MRIDDLLAIGLVSFSFEFMPPRDDGEVSLLERAIAELRPLRPAFVTVTYGAGGTTRRLTTELSARIKAETGIETMAHLTCAGHTTEELRGAIRGLHEAGIENVMAIRGDPPLGGGSFVPTPGGLRYGNELIALAHDVAREEGFDLCIGAAAYPEGHPENPDRQDDLRRLLDKIEAGATFFVTQLFFDNTFYFDLVERARRLGVTAPIIPGIMPITRAGQARRFVEHHGVTVPARLGNALARCESVREVRELGIEWATAQCRELLDAGAPGIHFFTFNRGHATRRVMHAIGNFPD